MTAGPADAACQPAAFGVSSAKTFIEEVLELASGITPASSHSGAGGAASSGGLNAGGCALRREYTGLLQFRFLSDAPP